MDRLPVLFAVAAMLAAALASVAVWSPRRLRVRLAALALAAAFLPAGYLGLAELLGQPKPMRLEWFRRTQADAVVLDARLREGEAIYLWLQLAESTVPRAYALPWDPETARQLQQAMRDADRQGAGLGMKQPFEPSWDKDVPQFYALPPPKLPEKGGAEDGGPMIYRHPGRDA